MNRDIGWAIWGCGAIANLVASDFRLVSGGKLCAVASRTVDNARRFASRHGVAKYYNSLELLLNDTDVDAVFIATPNHRHLADCLACIQAGKAVVCEKPFALNLAEARQIAAAARQRNVFCMEAMWTRFIPAVIEAKRCVTAGLIGSVRMMQGNFAYPVPDGMEARFFKAEYGGGALLDRGVYLVSLAQHLLGAPQSVSAISCPSVTGLNGSGVIGVDEQSAYQLFYANGALADFSASLRVRGTNEVFIAGERGTLRLCEPFYCAHRLVHRSHRPPHSVIRTDAGEANPAGLSKIVRAIRDSPSAKSLRRRLSPIEVVLRRGHVQTFPFAGNGYQFELRHVVECLLQGRTESPIMPLDDTLDVMRTMDLLRVQMESASRPFHMPVGAV